MLHDVVRARASLVGVCEAHLENVAVSAALVIGISKDYRGGRSGRSDREDLILCVGRGNGCAGCGSNRCQRELHAPVLENAVSGNCLFGIVRVVFELKLELNAALCVDLFYCDLSCILNSLAVNCCRACQGAGTADLDRACGTAFSGLLFCCGCAVCCRLAG